MTQNLPCATARSRTLTQTVKLIFIKTKKSFFLRYREKYWLRNRLGQQYRGQ
jgi:hypothetical protein